ncbi:MAG: PHB depolymerase family esterase [Pirellulales bacterium]
MSRPEPNDRTHLRTLTVEGSERRYLLHYPPQYDAARPWPVVLSFHGSNSNGQIQLEFTALNETADREGFIAVYPYGTSERERLLFWNAGNCCGFAHKEKIDDVALVRALLDQLAGEFNIDAARVYAAGMSNGAMMAYRLASEMAEVFAAVATVAGTMGTETCHPSRPVPIIHFHGTNDEFVPLAGGVGRRSVTGTNHFSVEHSIRAWVDANRCPPTPIVTSLPNAQDDGTSTVRHVYGPGHEGSEVVLYLIRGAGHIWPGRPPRPYYLGKTTYNVVANDLIWEFFQRHSRGP